jgi:hypothetical protein
MHSTRRRGTRWKAAGCRRSRPSPAPAMAVARGSRPVLRHLDRQRGDADRLSDRADARQLPVDIKYQPACLSGRSGANQGSDFYGAVIEAPGALALGLLNEMVPDVAMLQRRAEETAKLVAGHAPTTLGVTKEAVRRIRRTLTLRRSRRESQSRFVTVYGTNPWNAILTIKPEAGWINAQLCQERVQRIGARLRQDFDVVHEH